ncbi:unnamed protein product [Candida verbasci]|uniref:NEDD8-activating enzyme E1 catalytic subunit n=1 Tax=Candida verbasci TaxID=1227364 RepID=A0A9W4U0U7_9ASCO|nr:unnamed protein product [Candida verbasci]
MRDHSSVIPLLKTIGPFNEVADDYNYQSAWDRLSTSKILVIGAGGLGCEILKNLALTGFKNIHVIDMDTIDLSNLNRQFLFRHKDIGKSKSEIAANFIKQRIGEDNINIIPFFGKIQDKSIEFYSQFDLVISGLDSIEARRWINATLVNLSSSNNKIIPLIDGGTEGFRGQSRVIIPSFTSCFECTLDLMSQKITYPVCTIANTPRLPEHCIEWAHLIQWNIEFGSTKKFDADIPQHIQWMYETALNRAKIFKIEGVTKQLTLGVCKNIIPAIASTNSIIAASCCNEAFKLLTDSNPYLNNYMSYSGDYSIYTYTFENNKRSNCSVCGSLPKKIYVESYKTLQQFIEDIKDKQEIQIKNPSISSISGPLYMSSPTELQKITKNNLSKKLNKLISNGDEIVITDVNLPISLRLIVYFTSDEKDPELN